MKKRLFILIILIVIIIISGYYFWSIIKSPQYSLKQLKKAISENNITMFEKYVDLDSVIDNLITQAYEYYSSSPEEDKKNTHWDNIRQEIGNSVLSVIKPNLKAVIRKEVIRYVKTGQLPDNRDSNSGIYYFISDLLKDKINPRQWEHQSINYTDIEGNFANVGLTYYDMAKSTNIIVEVKMREMGGYWQVIEIINTKHLLNIFKNLNDS